MGVLKKLICKKATGDDDDDGDYDGQFLRKRWGHRKSSDDSTADVSSIDDLPAVMKFVSSSNMNHYDGSNYYYNDDDMMSQQSPQLFQAVETAIWNDAASQLTADYNTLEATIRGRRDTVCGETTGRSGDVEDNDYIVQQVRRSLRGQKGGKLAANRNDASNDNAAIHSRPALRDIIAKPKQRDSLKAWLLGDSKKKQKGKAAPREEVEENSTVQHMLHNIQMAEEENAKMEEELAAQFMSHTIQTGEAEKPKSVLRYKGMAPRTSKKMRWASTIEVAHTMCQQRSSDSSITRNSRSYFNRYDDGDYDDNSDTSPGGFSVTRSFDDNSIEEMHDRYDEERSVETMELVCNHFTCSPKDRIEASDWMT